ncbi:retrovirus-related pol polyprotein from transposon TNT 1-94 [Tanacetum coccineum]|uniref:Retrovirus-related pol polyprotein from transposon TNT 1-94 n=1 Tax=Tanacetum coccineum TaxID=301880 RepID=A0ABQ4ZS01_9ASTR
MGESSILIKLHAYLEQHELYANEVRIMCERNQDPLPYVENQQMTPPHFNPYQSSYNNPQLQQQFSPSQYGSIQHNQHYSSTYPLQPQFYHSPIPPLHTYQSQMNHQTLYVPQEIPQVAYQSPPSPTQPMISTILSIWFCCSCVFLPGEDQFACLNKTMAFLTDVASSSATSSGETRAKYSGTTYKGNASSSRGNTTSGHARVVKCYNCQGEGHMDRQCTQPKRPRNAAWYKEKAMLAEAQEAGQILDEEQLAFLVDPRVLASQAQIIIPHNVAFLTKDLDTLYSEPVMISRLPKRFLCQHFPLLFQTYLRRNIDFGRMDVPSKLPKVSLVNASLKKLKFHLTQFDSVVKKRTIPNALEEVEIQEYFEINDLKARLQDKDKTICKFKDTIKSLRENTKEENVNHEKYDLEPINKELENSVAKLLFENERLCNEINHVKPGSTLYKFQDACPNAITPSPKKVAITPVNNVKKVRFAEPLTSSSNIKQICLGVDLEPDEWIKDSGCSKHMTGNRKLFSTYKAYNGGNVIFGSNLRGNIIGKGQICDNKCRVTFSKHDSEITKNGKVISRGIKKKGLYVMKLGNKPTDKICLATIDENSILWHMRLDAFLLVIKLQIIEDPVNTIDHQAKH